MIASAGLCEFTSEQGVVLVEQDADLVLVLRDINFNYKKLHIAANLIRRGARLIVANPDATHPAHDSVEPETGAIVAAITHCSSPIEPVIIGKPSSPMIVHALSQQNVAADQAVMIGDNPDADIAGAERLGIPAVLIAPEEGVTLGSIVETVKLFRPVLDF
jgi:ribonucleotide monophosphatase NagD (HAD superfamily)